MKILISRANGGVSVMTLVPPAEWQHVADKWAAANPGQYVSHREAEDSEIPADRTFRNAWEDTGAISVNMPKAREIHKEKLRALRKPLLAALDTEYMRADESGDTAKKTEIAAKKQALRDATKDPAIEAASTPDELKQAIPDILKEK